MRRAAWLLAVLSSTSCALLGGPEPRPAPAPPAPAAKAAAAPAGCAVASILILRDATTGAVGDAVETRREVMRSDSFRKLMAKTAPTATGRSVLQVTRRGASAVLDLVATAAAPGDALATCGAALEASFAFGKEALEFLQQQGQALEAERAAKLKALQEYDLANDLLARPIEDRLAEARERVRTLGRQLEDPKRFSSPPSACKPKDEACRGVLDAPLKAALEQAREDARAASVLGYDRARRVQEIVDVEKRLDLVRTKLGDATLGNILQQDIKILDPCARCRADGG
ncbi:MAG: hypothetical protein QM765_42585 [Myxococcales bacterium]